MTENQVYVSIISVIIKAIWRCHFQINQGPLFLNDKSEIHVYLTRPLFLSLVKTFPNFKSIG